MKTDFYLEEKDGNLAVVSRNTSWQDPVMISTYWNVKNAINAAEFKRRVALDLPLPVTHTSGFPGFYYHLPNYQQLHIDTEERGESIETPFPCPPVRKGIETRYSHGIWQKYLKIRGWVNA